MYNYPYIVNNNLDRIDAQINELEKMKAQIQKPVQQPTNLTQNFQLAPSYEVIKYANSMEEVQRNMVIGDTPFFSKDMSIVWIKSGKGEIKAYELTEIIPKDEKDIQIALLQSQIEELRKEVKNNEWTNTNANESKNETSTSANGTNVSTTIKENEPSSISRISTSKKGK